MPESHDTILARLAVERGIVSQERVDEAVEIQRKAAEELGLKQDLATVLIARKDLTPEQADELRAAAAVKTGEAMRIGGYELVSKIGAGGMGAVYEAVNQKTRQHVALKILPPDLASEDMIKRFKRESAMAAKLDHAHIVHCVEFGFDKEKGMWFTALELVDGIDLDKYLKRKTVLPEEEAVGIARQIAMALQHAYYNELVHRDVKPGNIMVTPDGTAKLLDLGLTRHVANKEELTQLTQSGLFVGSPYYASPEQATADRDLDTRSDIYSLGATVYHMVTGAPPFSGSSAAQLLFRHVNETATWPGDVNPDLSDDVCQVIAKMMAKDPNDRYQTPKDLLAHLDSLHQGEQVEVKEDVLRRSAITPSAAPRAKRRRLKTPGRSVRPKSGADERSTGMRHRKVGSTARHRPVKDKKPMNQTLPMVIGGGIVVAAVIGLATIMTGGSEDQRRAPVTGKHRAQPDPTRSGTVTRPRTVSRPGNSPPPQTRRAAARPDGVPADAVEFSGHWYKHYEDRLTWEAARRRCEASGGRLACITSKAENNFICGLITGDSPQCWMGLTRDGTRGAWTWISGEPAVFLNWCSGQPDGRQSHVFGWLLGNTRVWFAGERRWAYPFICEWGGGPERAPARAAAHAPDLRRGLIGHWPFDEGNGSLAHDSGPHRHHGRVRGARWIAGAIGGALEFDGIDDGVDMGIHAAHAPSRAFTLAAWVRPARDPRTSSHGSSIVCKEGAYRGCQLTWRNGVFGLMVDDANVLRCPTRVKNDVWHHVSGTFDGNRASLYVNGKLLAARRCRCTPNTKVPLCIACMHTREPDREFTGAIDDFRMYDRALSPAEARELYGLRKAAGSRPVAPPRLEESPPEKPAPVAPARTRSAPAGDSLVLLDEEDTISMWSRVTLETDPAKVSSGRASGRCAFPRSHIWSNDKMPLDWSAYDTLVMRVYSERANGQRLAIQCKSPGRAGKKGYYLEKIGLEFAGWQVFELPLAEFVVDGSPEGWHALRQVLILHWGWDLRKLPDTRVWIDDMRLVKRAGGDRSYGPETTTLEIGGSVIDLVYVEPGSFTMGSARGNEEKPPHEVELTRGFYVGKHEVTREQFAAFVKATRYKTHVEKRGFTWIWSDDHRWLQIRGATWRTPGDMRQDDAHPVVCITHRDAINFCRWASMETGRDVRLPTEAEWECACRAGTTANFSFGVHASALEDYGWSKSNSGGATHAVGVKRPNPWGIYDMHGNVMEWVADRYADGYYASSPRANPTGPDTGAYVRRGGGWSSSPGACRSASRYRHGPVDTLSSPYYGFRVAVSSSRVAKARPAPHKRDVQPATGDTDRGADNLVANARFARAGADGLPAAWHALWNPRLVKTVADADPPHASLDGCAIAQRIPLRPRWQQLEFTARVRSFGLVRGEKHYSWPHLTMRWLAEDGTTAAGKPSNQGLMNRDEPEWREVTKVFDIPEARPRFVKLEILQLAKGRFEITDVSLTPTGPVKRAPPVVYGGTDERAFGGERLMYDFETYGNPDPRVTVTFTPPCPWLTFDGTSVITGVPPYHVRGTRVLAKIVAENAFGKKTHEVKIDVVSHSLAAIADAYVRGGAHADETFGDGPVLEVKREPADLSHTREALVRFDLSSLPADFAWARVRLFVKAAGKARGIVGGVARCESEWEEREVTWNSKPARGDELGRFTPHAGEWVEVDVTAAARDARRASRILCLRIFQANDVGSEDLVAYASRESGDETAPRLIVFARSNGGEE